MAVHFDPGQIFVGMDRQTLFETIETGRGNVAPRELAATLERERANISAGLNYYRPATAGSTTATAATSYASGEKELVEKLSSLLDLEPQLCHDLLLGCIKATLRDGEPALDPTDGNAVYLVSHYYMEERLASLLLMGAILRAHDDPSHVYHAQCTPIASDLLADNASVFSL
ncbi:MAG: hypothetical protein SGCHY_002026 [Lobulomycetales sp.]